MKSKILEAIALGKDNQPQKACEFLKSLLPAHLTDPDLKCQLAWTCDFMGNESDAVPYYDEALQCGLQEDRAGALLGLGSTYPPLGERQKSLRTSIFCLVDLPFAFVVNGWPR